MKISQLRSLSLLPSTITDNVVINFIIEKDAEDRNKRLVTSVMKGPSIVEELNKKLIVGQDILKVRVNFEMCRSNL